MSLAGYRLRGQPQQKIRPEHLDRAAVVYVRQSTRQQVLDHSESTRLQYALAERAVALGWARSQVVVIDDDLGVSAATADSRKGFARLVTEVTMGRAGIVLGIEMSRLARTGRDWHLLLELCCLSGVLLTDPDGVYDPVGLDYWIWPGRTSRLGLSLSDHFGCVPARTLPDGADAAPGVQGRRAPGAPARERGLAPPDRPGPLQARRPAVARGTVAIGSPPPVGRGVRGDTGDAAGLAPAAGHTQVGLHTSSPTMPACPGSGDRSQDTPQAAETAAARVPPGWSRCRRDPRCHVMGLPVHAVTYGY